MKVFAIFLLFLLGSLLAAALLFYPTWLGVSLLGEIPPHKLLNRLAKVLALLYFFLLLRQIHMNDPRALGYALPARRFIAHIGLGVALGTTMLLILSLALTVLDVRVADSDRWGQWERLPSLLLGGLGAGLAVAFIEETFFRGAMYGAIRRSGSMLRAATLSSVFYAALHFLGPRALPPDTLVGWGTGLEILANNFHRFADPSILSSLVALFSVGMLLALVRERTGNIALCIGLHTGWVMTIKATKWLTDVDTSADLVFLIGPYDGITGWLATAWVGVVALVYGWMSRDTGARRGRQASS